MKLANYFEEKWVGKIKVKWQPEEGLFSSGSSAKIAKEALKGHNGDVGKAIKSLNFFINRGGSKLKDSIRSKVESAIKNLQKKNED